MIYIVTESGGQYDDAYTTNLVASDDKTKAEDYIVTLEAEQAKRLATVEKLNTIRRDVDAALGKVQLEPFIDRKPWVPGLGKEQITQDMKNERLATDLKNKKIAECNQQMIYEREKIIIARSVEMLISLGYPEGHSFFTDRFYDSSIVEYGIDEVDSL